MNLFNHKKLEIFIDKKQLEALKMKLILIDMDDPF